MENQWLEAARDVDPTHADAQKREIAARAAAVGDKVLLQFDTISAAEQELWTGRDARRDLHYRIALLAIPIAALILVIALTTVAWREIRRASAAFADALRQAEAANQSKTNFLAVVSHELRNPLNSILLWCNALMSGGTLEGKTEQGINAIFRGAKAQAQLIEDLLDIARIESGQMRFDVQPIDSAEVVRAAVESMTPAAEAKSIAVQVVIDPRASMVMGDSHRLQQAVWNLLSNAIKFTPKGGKVQVRLERINSHLEIVVADNGQGIDRRALDSVFERFWQGTNNTTGDRGMGLGLSIVKHIVNLHGGTVTAHSDGLGHGSVFSIRLPLPVTTAGLENPARRHPTATAVAHSARTQRLEGISALFVDDDPATRDALSSLLISLGARVKTAPNVESALRAARSIESRRDYLRPWNARPRRLFAHQGDPGAGKGNRDCRASARDCVDGVRTRRGSGGSFLGGFRQHVVKPVAIAVPAIMLATATVALLWQSRVQMDETDWVEHTDRVMLRGGAGEDRIPSGADYAP